MKVAWLGSYHRDADRNAILLRGLAAAGVEVVELPVPLAWLRFRGTRQLAGQALRAAVTAPLRVLRFVRQARRAAAADVVVIGWLGHHDVALTRLLAPLLRPLRERPLVFDPYYSLYDTVAVDRGLLAPAGLAARALRRVEGWILRRPDLVLADTGAHARLYGELSGLPPERFAVVPVGADETLFTPQPLPPDDAPPTVLFYGTFIPLHGVETILGAAERLRGRGIRFRLIGAGQTRGAAERWIRDRHLGGEIALVDSVPRAVLPAEIAAATVVLGIFGDTPKANRVVPNKVYPGDGLRPRGGDARQRRRSRAGSGVCCDLPAGGLRGARGDGGGSRRRCRGARPARRGGSTAFRRGVRVGTARRAAARGARGRGRPRRAAR